MLDYLFALANLNSWSGAWAGLRPQLYGHCEAREGDGVPVDDALQESRQAAAQERQRRPKESRSQSWKQICAVGIANFAPAAATLADLAVAHSMPRRPNH